MNAPRDARWDTLDYQRITSASVKQDRLTVLFADGSWVEFERDRVTRPGVRGARWEELSVTPYEVSVPTAGAPLEIPWSTIRALTDKEYSAYLAQAAEEEARQIGLRLKELRERRNLSSKDLAERAGISPQSLSRIEHGHHDVVFTTLQRLLAAMQYTLADLEAAPYETPSVAEVMRRLMATGLSRELIVEKLLPRGLRERLRARATPEDVLSIIQGIAASVGAVFGWSVSAILHGESLTFDHALPQGVRFKKAATAAGLQTTAYVAYAHVLTRAVQQATEQLAVRPVPGDPGELQQAVLDAYGSLDFESVLRYTWSLGVPVIPLKDPGAFHGACWQIEGRPVIVLKQLTDSHARWLFDLLHELKHVASHLNAQRGGVVEIEEISPYARSGEEREASAFAGAVILSGRAEELTQHCVDSAGGSVEQLKRVVPRVAASEHVPADALANYIAFRLSRQGINWWGAANNLQVSHPDPWAMARDALVEHIDLGHVDPRSRALLQRAL